MADDDRTDAERIEFGLNPLQGEQLHDHDDLWRILERLGHERGDSFPTTVWDYVDWSCPLNECDGGLPPVDTRMRDLPANPEDLDESVDRDDPGLYLRLSEAQSPTVPVVACTECRSVFEASFRRLRDPEEYSLPEPRIVETPGTLSGRPRIDGTRIGVEHVLPFYERGLSTDEIAKQQYPLLSEEHVREAIAWADEHRDRLESIRRKDAERKLRRDTLQSAVDAAVEESLDRLWSVMADAKAEEGLDPVRPVASFLRNGFENADGLDIHIDGADRRVVINVADEVVARLNDDIDASPSDEPKPSEKLETATAGRGDWSGSTPTDAGEAAFGGDINERVEAEWVAETTPFERVRSVMATTYDEPASAAEVAERARTTDEAAGKHLRQLAGVGYVEATDADDSGEPRYRRADESVLLEQAVRILSEVDRETLEARVEEMEDDLRLYRERFDAESPEAAVAAGEEVNDEAIREWQRTQRNLGHATVALAVDDALARFRRPQS